MKGLELKVPPDVVWLGVAALMVLASALTPGVAVATALRVALAAALFGLGVGLIVAARASFSAARTTWHPSEPGRATSLVTTGVFGISRNPMYLGMLLVLVGLAVALANPLALVLSATFVLYINRFQIRPEERALLDAFGQGYRDYANRVRRWI